MKSNGRAIEEEPERAKLIKESESKRGNEERKESDDGRECKGWLWKLKSIVGATEEEPEGAKLMKNRKVASAKSEE